MSTNKGKKFEGEIKEALIKAGFSVTRLYDAMGGFYGVANHCDFIAYKFPFEFHIECKSTHNNTLNFKSGITETQWDGLTEKSNFKGCVAGIIIWFIEQEKTVFVPISTLNRFKQLGAKSISYDMLLKSSFPWFGIPGELKQIFFKYDANKLSDNFIKFAEGLW